MDDERKSLAIMNLQAILDLEDMDLVIQLLEQNNWDESVILKIMSLIVCSIRILCLGDLS